MKYVVQIRNAETGEEVDPGEVVILRAKDNAVPSTLTHYRRTCEALGAAPEFLAEIKRLQGRVGQWRADHPDECKVAD